MVKFYHNFRLAVKIFTNQLWLSVSSTNFYYDVFKYYRGYGFRYLFVVSCIISLWYSMFIINTLSNSNYYINQIIAEMPQIYFDGNQISIDEDAPFYITDNTKDKIIVFDLANKLSFVEKNKIPVVFSKNKLEIFKNSTKLLETEYSQLFNKEDKLISHEMIKQYIDKMLSRVINQLVLILPTLMLAMVFIINVLVNVLTVLPFYATYRLFGLNITFRTSMRLVIFMNAGSSLLAAVLSILIPKAYNLSWILLFWSFGLLWIGLNKVKEENLSKSYY